MKPIQYTLLFAFLSIAATTQAQRYLRSSAIQVQIPNASPRTQVNISSNNFQWSGQGNTIYLGNLYPNTYQIHIQLGARQLQTTVNLASGTQSRIFMGNNGQLLQQNQRNNNQNVLLDPRNVRHTYNVGVDDSWEQNPNTPPYTHAPVNTIPNTNAFNNNSQSYQDWILNYQNLKFNSDRVKYLRNTLKFDIDYITAKNIMKSLDFDSDKLEAAKYIVPNLHDPIGRRNLVELFSFDQGKQTYLKLLNQYRD